MSAVIICCPVYYDVIRNGTSIINGSLAITQWNHLLYTLRGYCSKILDVPASNTDTTMVFASSGALLCGNTAIVPRHDEGHWTHFLMCNQYTVHSLRSSFCGESDALFSHCGKHLWIGCGFHTERSAVTDIKPLLPSDVRVHSLVLQDSVLNHLDVCFCPLDSKNVMYYPHALTRESVNLIMQHFENCIEVSDKDARNRACNAIIVKNVVILHMCSETLEESLKEIGYKVIFQNMSEFLKSGKSCKSCVLKVNK